MSISKTKCNCPQWFCNKLKNLKQKETKLRENGNRSILNQRLLLSRKLEIIIKKKS